MKRSLLSLRISWLSNVDEFVHQIKEMKSLRRIQFDSDAGEAKIDEICSRVLKLNQHPYLSLFVGNELRKRKHVMRPDEKYIVASDDQWEETFSKEKLGGTLHCRQCQSCDENYRPSVYSDYYFNLFG